jgi:hypothetical protein
MNYEEGIKPVGINHYLKKMRLDGKKAPKKFLTKSMQQDPKLADRFAMLHTKKNLSQNLPKLKDQAFEFKLNEPLFEPKNKENNNIQDISKPRSRSKNKYKSQEILTNSFDTLQNIECAQTKPKPGSKEKANKAKFGKEKFFPVNVITEISERSDTDTQLNISQFIPQTCIIKQQNLSNLFSPITKRKINHDPIYITEEEKPHIPPHPSLKRKKIKNTRVNENNL